MKSLILALLFCSAAVAQESTDTTDRKAPYASLFYSFADTIKYDGTASGVNVTGQDNASGALGLGLGWIHLRENKFGYSVGLTYDFSRSASSGNATIGTVPVTFNYSPATKVTVLDFLANLNYSSKQLVGYAGVNYPSVSTENSSYSYSAKLGWQVGLGYQIDPNWNVSAEYRTLYVKATSGTTTLNSVSLNGIMLRVSYLFDI